jgi:hypothetical protein
MSHMRDPELEFGDPKRLADDVLLSAREKLAILVSWQSDLIELLRAEEENMPSVGAAPGTTAKKLSEVTAVIAAVRAKSATTGHQSGPAGASPSDDVPPGDGVRQPPKKPYRPGVDVPKPSPIDDPAPAKPHGEFD